MSRTPKHTAETCIELALEILSYTTDCHDEEALAHLITAAIAKGREWAYQDGLQAHGPVPGLDKLERKHRDGVNDDIDDLLEAWREEREG